MSSPAFVMEPECIEPRLDAAAPNRGAKPSRCWCGSGLRPSQPRGGRPARFCSERCRRTFDHLQRKIRLRQQALTMWRAEKGLGSYTRARIRAEVRQLQEELQALSRELDGGGAQHHGDRRQGRADRAEDKLQEPSQATSQDQPPGSALTLSDRVAEQASGAQVKL